MNSGHATLIDGKVYYGGGLTNTPYADNLVHRYDLAQEKWDEPLPDPLDVKHFRLSQINRELVATGGVCKRSRQIQNAVYTFDRGVQRWKRDVVPSMLTPRYFHGVLSLELQGVLIVAGGQASQSNDTSQDNCYTNSVEIYKSCERMWYQTKSLPVPFFNMATAVSHGMCYVAGGFKDNPGALSHVYCATVEDLLKCIIPADCTSESIQGADTSHSVWKSLPNTPSYQSALCVLGGKVFAIGGFSEPKEEGSISVRKTIKSIWQYSPDSESWRYTNDLPDLYAPTLSTVISVSPNEIMIIGGAGITEHVNTVFMGFL